MKIGFTVISSGKNVEFQLFDPYGDGQPPLLLRFFQSLDYTVILIGRLYYRSELLADLAAAARPHSWFKECESNDAALALATYRGYGLKGIERLEGDFALGIWDATAGRLIGARDPMGGYPLFWTEQGGTIAFSTNLYELLKLIPKRSVDLEYLAEYLMLPGQVQEVNSERSVYQGIQRLPAGSILSVLVTARRIERHVYWNWLDRLIDPQTNRLEEISERYAGLLRDAVRERICGRIASHLSGGMDSTTISLIARDWIQVGIGEFPLNTLSLVYEHLPGLAGEKPYLESALRDQKGIKAHYIPADDILDFDSYTDPPPHDEPYAGLNRLSLDRATIESTIGCGANTMLTGIGADEMLIMEPFEITDYLRRGRFGAAWAEACRWARVDNCSPWTFLYSYGIANILPAWMRGGVKTALKGGYASWKNQNEWTIAPWIRQTFARRYSLRSRAIEHALRNYNLCKSPMLSFALYAIRCRIGDVNRWFIGVPRNLLIAHPFLDARVLSFSLGMKIRLKAQPEGQKPILARAMRGLLPEQIINRHGKGDFNAVYFLGIARNLQSLETMVRKAPLDDLNLLDKNVLLECLNQTALGSIGSFNRAHRLNLTLAFIKWFSMQDEWQRAAEPPTKIIRHTASPQS